MGFFDDLHDLSSSEDDLDEAERWAEVGMPIGIRLVLFQTPEAAVLVSRFIASRLGVDFEVVALLRRHDETLHKRVEFGFPFGSEPPDPLDPRRFRLGVQFSDGRKLTNLDEQVWLDEDGPGLIPGGGGVSGNPRDGTKFQSEYHLTPLPPPGPLVFVCEWIALGIPESRATVDAGVFRQAAAETISLWETL